MGQTESKQCEWQYVERDRQVHWIRECTSPELEQAFKRLWMGRRCGAGSFGSVSTLRLKRTCSVHGTEASYGTELVCKIIEWDGGRHCREATTTVET